MTLGRALPEELIMRHANGGPVHAHVLRVSTKLSSWLKLPMWNDSRFTAKLPLSLHPVPVLLASYTTRGTVTTEKHMEFQTHN